MGVLKVLKGTLSTLGKKNRNGRVYSKELWENVLNSEYWNDMVSNNSLFGECVHPADNRSTSDPFEIDANNVSHRISEAHIEGDRLIGTVEILDTDAGRNIASLIDSGCNIGISARGAGDLNGDEVDPDTYQFKTFDLTFRPSDFNARLTPLTESEKKNFRPIKESEETDTLVEKADKTDGRVYDQDSQLNSRIQDEFVKKLSQSSLIDKLKESKAKLTFDLSYTTSDTNKYRINIYGPDKNVIDKFYVAGDVSREELESLIDKSVKRIEKRY